ncbi:RF-PROK-I domain-containing protein [Mycena venus]|uniref:RF-PROK-I domain-containing protein n=1 Tax=Mycena venus TaxID=2733690 RepID=A0A8H7CGU1_9AGAR|nr:RF-PROK-I domain-containing protein [Mycena venus]
MLSFLLRHVHSAFYGHSCVAKIRKGSVLLIRNAHNGGNRPILIPPQLASLESPQDTALARTWIAQFRALDIPKSSVQLSFSRSSGPGGQNVNKVNTKVTLRCAIDEDWIPLWAKSALKRSPHYVSSSQSIQITSTVHRSQSQNIEECLLKVETFLLLLADFSLNYLQLHALLVEASSSTLKNEPSDAQRKRVEDLVKAANARRRAEKSYRSSIKAGRKARPD